MYRCALLIIPLTLTVACEEKKSNKLTLGTQAADCSLTLDGLSGTNWVIEKINPDKSVEPDKGTRLQFNTEDGKLVAKYNVGSLSDMYDYPCESKGDEIICREGDPHPKDFCQALLTGGAECTTDTLKALVPDATDEEIAKGIEEATANVEKYKAGPQWDQFVLNNNNLGNKLRGLLYAKVDTRSCKLRITDNYLTVYNGKKIEDSNPVGTNLFVQTEDELLWEHCSNDDDMMALASDEVPTEEPQTQIDWGSGATVNYHFLGKDAFEPAEGCTYSFDTWLNSEPLAKDIAATEAEFKGKPMAKHHFTHTFDEPGVNVMMMTRYKTCEGKKETIETACNLVRVN